MVITDKSEFVSIVRSLHERKVPKLDADTAGGLQEFIDKIPFYHKIELADGIFTPGFMTYEQSIVLRSVEKYITGGSRVLDVGCRDGLFTVAAHKKGAKEIVALDIDPSEGFKEIVAPVFDMSNVQYLIGNFLDPSLEISGEFDFVIFSGLLYHLRYPFLGLRKAADLLKDGGMMILETAYLAELPDLPILLCPVGDFSPFEPTSVTFFNRRGLSDTLASFGLKVIDVVAEFTFILGNKTRYEEFQFPGARLFRKSRGAYSKEFSGDSENRLRPCLHSAVANQRRRQQCWAPRVGLPENQRTHHPLDSPDAPARGGAKILGPHRDDSQQADVDGPARC